VTPAVKQLQRSRIVHTLHPYHHAPDTRAYGDEAVAALGVAAERVFKTLVVALPPKPDHLVVAVIPVPRHLDLKVLAQACGAKKAEMADPKVAERATGYLTGGISPLGQRKRLPTVLDASALKHPTIYVSAGRRGLQVELAPADLQALLAAATAEIAR
jgi:Cys-tRNA(Pro)/Cys-tRNA(Cys) deacylase